MTTDIKPAVDSIMAAAKYSMGVADRVGTIKVSIRGVETSVPIATDKDGAPRVLDGAIESAVAQADRIKPERTGAYVFDDLGSLLAWATRFKIENSAAFLRGPTSKQNSGEICVTIDELPKDGDGALRELYATVDLSLSDALGEWLAGANTWMSSEAFHGFMDRHAEELGSSDALTMSKNVEVRSDSIFKRTVDDSGVTKIIAEDNSGPAMRVPRSFTFAAPVFDFDDDANAHTFTARLTMKLEKGRPMFKYEIVDFKRRIADAMQVMRADVAKVVPTVYMGIGP